MTETLSRSPAPSLGGEERARFEDAWRRRAWQEAAEVGRSLLARPAQTASASENLALRVAVALAAAGRTAEARSLLGEHPQATSDAEARLVELLTAPPALRGDALEIAARLEGELAVLRAGLARSR